MGSNRLPVVLAAAPLLLALLGAAPARAVPTTSTQLAWPTLGLPAGLSFSDPDAGQTYTIPVPKGLSPTSLDGVLHAPVNLGRGYLEVDREDGTFVAAVALPDAAVEHVVTAFHVPLDSIPVHRDVLKLTLVVRQATSSAVQCGPRQQLAVTGLSTTFSGTPQPPRTIDTFLPPVVSALTVYVDPHPTPAEQQATTSVVAAVAAHVAPLPMALKVLPLARDGALPVVSGAALQRSVVIRQTGSGGLAVVPSGGAAPLLQLTGNALTLPMQTALLTTRLTSLAQVAGAIVTQPAGELRTSKVLTFSELGIGATATVLGQRVVGFTLDQTMFGRSVQTIEVHLNARYTPVQSDATGTVAISVGGVVLATRALGSSGLLDLTFAIPKELLANRTNVQIALSYAPRFGCTAVTPQLTFSVDPRSTVNLTPLSSAAGGFNALPAAFVGGFDMLLGGTNLTTLSVASHLIADLQQNSGAVLIPTVVTEARAKLSQRPLLAVVDSTVVSRLALDPPLSGSGANLAAAVPGTVKITVEDGLGSVQIFADTRQDRTVLLATTTASWTLLDPLMDYLAAPATSWSTVAGDVLLNGQAHHPAVEVIRAGGALTFAPAVGRGWLIWIYLGVAAGLFAGAFAMVRALTRRARHAG